MKRSIRLFFWDLGVLIISLITHPFYAIAEFIGFKKENRWRHVASGRIYRVRCHAINLSDGMAYVIYDCEEDSRFLAMPQTEFYDGRFKMEE